MTIIKSTALVIAAAASLGFFGLTLQPALAGGGHGHGGHGKHGGGHGKHGGWHGGHGHHGHHGHRRHFRHGGFYPAYGYANPCVVTYGPYGPMQVCY